MMPSMLEKDTNSSKGQFLSFTLGNEEFCLDILNVQEIRGYDAITPIANTPAYMKGVINLRDRIVPIIDLRIKFAFEKVGYDDMTIVIILNVEGNNFGVVVDGVTDVIALNSTQICDLPASIVSIDTEYITGVVTIDSTMLLLLDINKLVNIEAIAGLAPKLLQ